MKDSSLLFFSKFRFSSNIIEHSSENYTVNVQETKWVPVKGFSLYEIGEIGVRNKSTYHLKKTWVDLRGYVMVSLTKDDGKGDSIKQLHQLIAKHFIPNPDNLPVVHHKDANRKIMSY